MSDAFITYKKNKGFWINESFMQLAFHYIHQELEKKSYSFLEKEILLEDLKDNINGLCRGYIGLNWHENLRLEEEQTMLNILHQVKSTLKAKGTYISVEELMSIPTEDHILRYMLDKKPFPTEELIRVMDALTQMLKGTWDSTNYDMDLKWRYHT